MSTGQRSAFSVPKAARLLPFIGMVLLFGCAPENPTEAGETAVKLQGPALRTNWLPPIVFVDGVRRDEDDQSDIPLDQIETVRVLMRRQALKFTQDGRSVIFINLKDTSEH